MQIPGLIAGVLQVNVQIPPGVAAGNGVPIVLNIGRQTSFAERTPLVAAEDQRRVAPEP